MTIIEDRVLFELRGLKITGYMEDDPDGTPFDADCYDEATIQAWRDDAWRYVYMRVTVAWNDRVIGESDLGGIEHGDGFIGENGEPISADAWSVTPVDYPPGVVHTGSPLAGIIGEAIADAVKWVNSIADGEIGNALTAANQWIDPNAPKRPA